MFFPPRASTEDEFAGVRWGEWEDAAEEHPIRSWVGDQDLLSNAASGASLPVGTGSRLMQQPPLGPALMVLLV